MNIKEVTNKEEWDGFVLRKGGSFLQSFDWGNLKEKEGNKVFRFAVSSKNKTIFQAQVIREKLPFSKFYFHLPYGPVGEGGEELLARESKKRGAKFLFIEPQKPFNRGSNSSLRIEPQETSIIDLRTKDLLSTFKKNTRYSIRNAQKKEVEVKEEEYDEDFFRLLEETKKRQGFFSYPRPYFPLLLSVLDASFFTARYQGKLVAGAIIVFWGKRATYIHAASDYNYRDFSAPALLQFHICEELQRRGFEEYDLWGIDETRIPGVSFFKKGFGGKRVVYPQSKKVSFSSLWYTAYIAGKKIKHYEKLTT